MARAQLSLFPEAAHAPTLRDVAEAVRAAGIDGLPDATKRADQARYQEVHVRSALAEAKGMPFRWTLNPYRGCTHACEYCYARKYQRHLELDAGDTFSTLIFVKQNLPQVLKRDVERASWEREVVAIGTATDPYQPIEGHYKLTRRVSRCSSTPTRRSQSRPRARWSSVTSTCCCARSARAGARVNMSIPSMDDVAWAKLEPGTAPPAQRLRAARTLMDAGVEVGVMMMPLVPGITTSRSSIETNRRRDSRRRRAVHRLVRHPPRAGRARALLRVSEKGVS
jgi:DNA repair photolyase